LAPTRPTCGVELDPGELEELATLAEPPERYWQERAGLSWS
jgi:hypothetical protein